MKTTLLSHRRPAAGRCLGLALALGVLTTVAPAAQQLLNPSFEEAAGAHWAVTPDGWATDPFAVAGEVDLSMMVTTFPAKVLWQDLDIRNVAGATGTASMELKQAWGPDFGNSIAVYLDYVDDGGSPQRLLLLNPANDEVDTESKYFSVFVSVPANAQRITGFSVDKTDDGGFQALEFGLDLSVPTVAITNPTEGASFTAGSSIPIEAWVNTAEKSITSVEFYANTTLIGQAQSGPYGEWSFPDGSYLSVLDAGSGFAFVDYSPPEPEQMYMLFGSIDPTLFFAGTFDHWNGTEMVSGNAGVQFSFGAGGTLNADMFGMPPLGARNLAGGTNSGIVLQYTATWPNVPAGSYALTAKLNYGSGESVTSPPVHITVGAAVVVPALRIQRVSATEVELSWPDTGAAWQLVHQAGLAAGGWTAVVGTPVLADGRYSLRVAIAGPAEFFRLQQP